MQPAAPPSTPGQPLHNTATAPVITAPKPTAARTRQRPSKIQQSMGDPEPNVLPVLQSWDWDTVGVGGALRVLARTGALQALEAVELLCCCLAQARAHYESRQEHAKSGQKDPHLLDTFTLHLPSVEQQQRQGSKGHDRRELYMHPWKLSGIALYPKLARVGTQGMTPANSPAPLTAVQGDEAAAATPTASRMYVLPDQFQHLMHLLNHMARQRPDSQPQLVLTPAAPTLPPGPQPAPKPDTQEHAVATGPGGIALVSTEPVRTHTIAAPSATAPAVQDPGTAALHFPPPAPTPNETPVTAAAAPSIRPLLPEPSPPSYVPVLPQDIQLHLDPSYRTALIPPTRVTAQKDTQGGQAVGQTGAGLPLPTQGLCDLCWEVYDAIKLLPRSLLQHIMQQWLQHVTKLLGTHVMAVLMKDVHGWLASGLAPLADAPADTGEQGAPDWELPATTRRKRARVRKDGALSLIAFGYDEKLVWAKRVGLFIRSMRTALGDRSMRHAWGGSVLDSVVGVYLTQNASDVLSSNAFLTLASSFPSPAWKAGLRAAAASKAMTSAVQDDDAQDKTMGTQEEAAGDCAAGMPALKQGTDMVDWNSVRVAPPEKVSSAIECRGMQFMLTTRIQAFLNELAQGIHDMHPLTGDQDAAGNKGSLGAVAGQRQGQEQSGGEPASKRQHTGSVPGGPIRVRSGYAVLSEGPQELLAAEQALQNMSKARLKPLQPAGPEKKGKRAGKQQADAAAAAHVSGAADQLAVATQTSLSEQDQQQHPPLASDASGAQIEHVAGPGQQLGSDGAGASGAGLPCVPQGQSPLSLEWVRSVSGAKASEYLMRFDGLGRKSAGCVLLLSLGMKDFPVDINVARVCARLGWVPLQADVSVTELDEYPDEPQVHKYLSDRLNAFDLETLYELHYLMITLGKVFCQKRLPNCSSCPLEADCDYAQCGGPRLGQPGGTSAPKPKPSEKASPVLNTPRVPIKVEMEEDESAFTTTSSKPAGRPARSTKPHPPTPAHHLLRKPLTLHPTTPVGSTQQRLLPAVEPPAESDERFNSVDGMPAWGARRPRSRSGRVSRQEPCEGLAQTPPVRGAAAIDTSTSVAQRALPVHWPQLPSALLSKSTAPAVGSRCGNARQIIANLLSEFDSVGTDHDGGDGGCGGCGCGGGGAARSNDRSAQHRHDQVGPPESQHTRHAPTANAGMATRSIDLTSNATHVAGNSKRARAKSADGADEPQCSPADCIDGQVCIPDGPARPDATDGLNQSPWAPSVQQHTHFLAPSLSHDDHLVAQLQKLLDGLSRCDVGDPVASTAVISAGRLQPGGQPRRRPAINPRPASVTGQPSAEGDEGEAAGAADITPLTPPLTKQRTGASQGRQPPSSAADVECSQPAAPVITRSGRTVKKKLLHDDYVNPYDDNLVDVHEAQIRVKSAPARKLAASPSDLPPAQSAASTKKKKGVGVAVAEDADISKPSKVQLQDQQMEWQPAADSGSTDATAPGSVATAAQLSPASSPVDNPTTSAQLLSNAGSLPEERNASSLPEERNASSLPEERNASSLPEERNASSLPEERNAEPADTDVINRAVSSQNALIAAPPAVDTVSALAVLTPPRSASLKANGSPMKQPQANNQPPTCGTAAGTAPPQILDEDTLQVHSTSAAGRGEMPSPTSGVCKAEAKEGEAAGDVKVAVDGSHHVERVLKLARMATQLCSSQPGVMQVDGGTGGAMPLHLALGILEWPEQSEHPSAAAVKSRYRELCVWVHPDKSTHPEAASAFASLTQALHAALRAATSKKGDRGQQGSAQDEPEVFWVDVATGGIRIPAYAKEVQEGGPAGSTALVAVKQEAVQSARNKVRTVTEALVVDVGWVQALEQAGLSVPNRLPDDATPHMVLFVKPAASSRDALIQPGACAIDAVAAAQDKWVVMTRAQVGAWARKHAALTKAESMSEAGGAADRTTSHAEHTVGMVLLKPMRSSLLGAFPLSATYFQTNEVFVDYASAEHPVPVSAALGLDLGHALGAQATKWRTVYFGSSTASIVRDMSLEQVSAVFHQAHIGIRCYEQHTGAPKPLPRYLMPYKDKVQSMGRADL